MEKLRQSVVESLTSFIGEWRQLEDSVFQKESRKPSGEEEAETRTYQTMVAEMRTALTTILEKQAYTTEEFAAALSSLMEALEELDPELFADGEDGEEDAEDEDDELDDEFEEEEETEDDEKR